MAGALPDGKKNLMVLMPPRMGKTEKISIDFPAWAIGHIPDCEFILTSYSKDLARRNTMRVRNIIGMPWFREMFPDCRIGSSGDRAGADRQDYFETTMGGCVYGVGSGGTITGFGAGKLRDGFGGAIIIDDPIKASDRRSETIRENMQDWYINTIKTRRNSHDTPLILVMQRLDPEDLAGFILKEEPDDWHVVRYQGFDEDTQASIWEERMSTAEMLKMRDNPISEVTFWTQIQQDARRPGGNMVKEDWWCHYDDPSEIRKRCSFFAIFADTAQKEKQHNDYTCFSMWGFEGATRAYKIDRIKGKWNFPDLIKAAHAFWDKHYNNRDGKGIRAIFIEDKVSGTSLIQTLQNVHYDKDGTKYQPLPVVEWNARDFDLENDDKVSRVRACSFDIYGERIWIPNHDLKDWVTDHLNEWSNFSEDMSHAHDDEVDADTMAILTWKAMGGGLEID